MVNATDTQATFMVPPKSDASHLDIAIARVAVAMRSEGEKPGAEKWTADSRIYRARMVARVFEEWQSVTGEDAIFPYHDDYVCERWLAWRKAPTAVKVEFCRQHRIAWKSGSDE